MHTFLAGSTNSFVEPAAQPETGTLWSAFVRLMTSLVHATAQTIPLRESDELTPEWFRYPPL